MIRPSVLHVVCYSCVHLCVLAAQAQSPDMILYHGHIFTGDTAIPWVEAISIHGNTILATGSNAKVMATADKHTQIIDLQGRMAMPGINDAHEHVGGARYGIEAVTKLPPAAHPSIDDVAEAVRVAAGGAAAGEWIHGEIGSPAISNPVQTMTAIDKAAGDHPVILQSWVGHGAILNRLALAKLGITDGTPDPIGGHYDRDSDGHLTGKLEEYAGDAIWMRLADQAEVEKAVSEFRPYVHERLEQGVTSVQVMATNQRLVNLEKTFIQADQPIRIRIMRFPIPAEDALNGDRTGSGEEVLTPLIRVAGVKWILDGTPIDDQLAFETKDYPGRPGWRGRPNFSVDFIGTQLKLALTGKDQLMLHIVGDAMTDEVMDEMEKLAPAERWRPLRVRFEHGDGFTTPERLARAHKLGIVVAQPRPGRNFRGFLDAGVTLAYGSDHGMAPFFMFSVMTSPGNPNAISRLEALAVLTSGPAFAEFQETKKGKLTPGMLADVAVLSQDIMTAAPPDLPKTTSVLTLVGGKVAYRSSSFETAASAAVQERH
jgi:hypothetical protein